MAEMRERMLRGELYIADDPENEAEFAVVLDVAPVTIGAACQIATRVQLLTATHPIDPGQRACAVRRKNGPGGSSRDGPDLAPGIASERGILLLPEAWVGETDLNLRPPGPQPERSRRTR